MHPYCSRTVSQGDKVLHVNIPHQLVKPGGLDQENRYNRSVISAFNFEREIFRTFPARQHRNQSECMGQATINRADSSYFTQLQANTGATKPAKVRQIFSKHSKRGSPGPRRADVHRCAILGSRGTHAVSRHYAFAFPLDADLSSLGRREKSGVLGRRNPGRRCCRCRQSLPRQIGSNHAKGNGGGTPHCVGASLETIKREREFRQIGS